MLMVRLETALTILTERVLDGRGCKPRQREF